MNFGVGRVVLTTGVLGVVGVAAYAIYKAGGVKPAAKTTVKTAIKAKDWAKDKYSCAKGEVERLVDEAKADMAEV